MGGSQKNIGQGKDGAATNPIRQKPYRRNGLQRKCQHEIPVPKSEENGAATNPLLKCLKLTMYFIRKEKKGGAATNPYLQREKC